MKWKRVLFKLSGEALAGGAKDSPINDQVLERVAGEIVELHQRGVQIAIVTGGGNILRGSDKIAQRMDRAQADNAGMLATMINSLMLQGALEYLVGDQVRVLTAIETKAVAELYVRRKAIGHMEKGRIVILAGGTGLPYHTTDFTASQRAAELHAEMLLKGTSVDGVYSADPNLDPEAKMFPEIPYEDVYRLGLEVMDLNAINQCRERNVPITVFNVREPGNLVRVVTSEERIGTLIHDPRRSGIPALASANT